MDIFEGGGWIAGNIENPEYMGSGPDHGRGVWAQPPPADGSIYYGTPPGPGNPDLMAVVDEWDRRFLAPRYR